MPTLSIVVPCFNEQETLVKGVERIRGIAKPDLTLEIVIVDDCSRDASLQIARDIAAEHPEVRVLHHDVNQGKGAALRTGFKAATGDFVAVQDADLEYNPQELVKLIAPLQDGSADMVVGSRFLSAGCHRVLYFWHSMGNRFLTLLSNMFTDLNLTDMETCYKVFRREVIQAIPIEENRFGFEPEIVAKAAIRRLRIFEMGISYHGRTYEEGKKIGWRDGFRAIYCILRYNANTPVPTVRALYKLYSGGLAVVFSFVVNVIAWLAGMPAALGSALSAGGTAALVLLLVLPILSNSLAARVTMIAGIVLTAALAGWAGWAGPVYPVAVYAIWLFGAALAWKAAYGSLTQDGDRGPEGANKV